MKTKLFNPVTLKPKFRLYILTIYYLLLTTYSFSQAPQGFNYQAVARDSDNAVMANTDLDVKIGLLQGGENGTLIWEEIHEVTTNDIGLFTLTIGDTTATYSGGSAATFSAIDWTVGSFYLQVQVYDGTGYVDLGTTKLNSVPYALYAESGNVGPQGPEGPQGPPGDPATDDQTLSVDGHDLTISEGNTVPLPDSVIDDDADPANEIQDLQLTDNDLSITNNASATNIDLSPYLDNTDSWSLNGDSIYYMGSVGVGTSTPASKMAVQGDDVASEEPLFEVKRKDGQTVFAVYNEGVRVFVDTSSAKGPKGGFAVGGFSASKGISQEYMRITPDSVRVYVDKESTKGPKGGFAVGGFSASKAASQEFLRVTPDSVRVYIDETISKGPKGGFAVGGFSPGKAVPTDLMSLTKENYFIGHNSGSNITTGRYNSFFGYQAGYHNTIGENNSFFGPNTGFYNSSGSNNSFIGYYAGMGNYTGSNNTYLGYRAGYSGGLNSNASGSDNVFIGVEAGESNTIGHDNIGIGNLAGNSNTSGNYNVYIGTNAGTSNQTADYNTMIGYQAGETTTGGYNTMVGYLAGQSNNSGTSQALFGYKAGWNNTGGHNTFIGTEAGNYSGAGDYNVYVGVAAGRGCEGSRNVFIGKYAGYGEPDANDDRLVIENDYTGQYNYSNALIYGNFDTDNLRFNANVGINRSGSTNYGLYVDGGSSYEMRVVGDAHASGAFYSDSDIRLKKNIASYKNALEKILKIRGVTFEWRMKEFPDEDYEQGTRIGVIAQEVEKVFPELVSNDGEYKGVAYSKLSAVLIEAIKEQQKQIEELKKEIEAIKKEKQ